MVTYVNRALAATVGLSALWAIGAARADTTLTIATVNNGDMVVMQKLSSQFEFQHPDIHLRWVVLEENVLRQRVTTDIATHARPVRHSDHRKLRGADLGKAGVARGRSKIFQLPMM